MGVQNPQVTTLSLHAQNGEYRSGAVLPTTRNNFKIIEPFRSDRTLRAFYPRVNEVALDRRHAFNTTYPGAKYRSLIQATGGSPPYLFEIVRAPAGMTIGEFLTADSDGDLWPNASYGVLTHDSMPGGSFSIAVRCTDQTGAYITFEWVLDSDLSLNFFTAPANVGTGSGLSAANAKALSATYIGATTNSPAKGKVVRVLPGDYVGMSEMQLNSAFHPMSWVGSDAGESIFRAKIKPSSNDFYIQGITLSEVGTGAFGVIDLIGQIHRSTVFNCTLNRLFGDGSGADNRACIAGNALAGNVVRTYVTIVDCLFKNIVDVHAWDFYAVGSLLAERNRFVYDDPSIVFAELRPSMMFNKADCYEVQYAYNVYDNPQYIGSDGGLLQPYSGVSSDVGESQWRIDVYYNKFRSGAGGNICRVNAADNDPVLSVVGSVTITTRIERNSLVGEVNASNTDRNSGVEKQAFFAKNAVQSANGVRIASTSSTVPQSPVWFTNTGTECQASSGVFDANFKLTPAYATQLGKRGAQLRRIPG